MLSDQSSYFIGSKIKTIENGSCNVKNTHTHNLLANISNKRSKYTKSKKRRKKNAETDLYIPLKKKGENKMKQKKGHEMVRFPGRSAALRVLSISFLAFLLRISTLTLELLSIFIYGLLFFDFFFRALTFDFIVSTKLSNWFAIFVPLNREKKINGEARELDFLASYLFFFAFKVSFQ